MKEAIESGLYDPKIMVESENAFEMSREIVRKEGIYVGMSSGAVMYVSKNLSDEINWRTIATIFPDRGEKYLNTLLFE